MKRSALNLLIPLLLISLLCGCSAEKPATPITPPPGAGGEASAELPSAEPGTSAELPSPTPEPATIPWPHEKMGDLPEPDYMVLSITDTEKGANVSLGSMTPEDVAAYIQAVQDLGYATQAEGEDELGGLIYSGSKSDSTVVILYTVDDSSSGTGLCQITYEQTN